VTDGGAEKVLACSGSSLPGAARAARRRDNRDTGKGRVSRSRPGLPHWSRTTSQGVVLIVDDDLAATLEV